MGAEEAKEGLKKQFTTTRLVLLGSAFELCPETNFSQMPNLLLSKTIPQH